jgi:hypothetical protein
MRRNLKPLVLWLLSGIIAVVLVLALTQRDQLGDARPATPAFENH